MGDENIDAHKSSKIKQRKVIEVSRLHQSSFDDFSGPAATNNYYDVVLRRSR